MDIYNELNTVFRRVFDDDEISVNATSTSNDIEGWDSLSHTNLVVAVEKHFGIRFKNSEILKWKNVGEMCASVEAQLAAKG
jgi:acyl carrier protein